MEKANYKIYKTMVNGQPFFNILPGLNTPYGYTEANLDEARAWYAQHPDVYKSESLYDQPLEQVLSGQTVATGYSKDAKGNWGTWDAIALEQKKNDDAVAAGTMKKVPVGDGWGYVPTGSASDQQNSGINNTTTTVATPINNQNPSSQSSISYADFAKNWKLINPNLNDAQVKQAYDAFYPQGMNTQNTTGTNATNATGATGTSSGGITINGQNYSTGNPQTDAALQAMMDQIKEQQAKGNVINPDLQITPEILQQFTDYVTDKVHPQFAEAIQNVKQDLTRNFDSLKAKYDYENQNQEGQFKQQLGTARENYAGSGLAFSGQRGQGETNMANNENRTLDYNALLYGNQAGDYARNAEKQIGASNMTGYQLPEFAKKTASLTGNGGYSANGTYGNSYTPGSYTLGSIPSEEAATVEAGKQSLINQQLTGAQYGQKYQDLISPIDPTRSTKAVLAPQQ